MPPSCNRTKVDLTVREPLSQIDVAVVHALDGIDVRVDAEQAGLDPLRMFHFVLGVQGQGHCGRQYQAGGSNHDVIFKLPNLSKANCQPGGTKVVDP